MNDNYKTYQAPPGLLRDRVILITGASDGIGRALALGAAQLGGQIILHGRNVQKLEKVYDEIEAIDGAPRPSIAVLDLASANSTAYESLASSLADEFGISVTIMRLAFVLGTLASGMGIVIYLVLWVVMPVNESTEIPHPPQDQLPPWSG